MNKLSTGVAGLDEILYDGLIEQHSYLVRGGPGTGKTTLGFHFLNAGASKQEPCLFITLGETEERLKENAAKLGISLEHVNFLDLSPKEEFYAQTQTYDIFHAAEVETTPMAKELVATVEHLKPRRVFMDSLSMLQYLTADPYMFRKQSLAFMKFLNQQGATFLFTTEPSLKMPDDEFQFWADGVVNLESQQGNWFVNVIKYRGSAFRKSRHAFRLTDHGMEVYPMLIAQEHQTEFSNEMISAGIPEIDELLSGGVERGTVTILTGPSGVGKTTFGLMFMKEAAGRGERSVVFSFEESRATLLKRSEGVNIPISKMVERGTLDVIAVEPLRYSPDEFALLVRREVEQHKAQIVMIDSISGLRISVAAAELNQRLHALTAYLRNMGVTVFLINEIENVTGEFKPTDLNISYLADNIIFLRYIEFEGELRKTIGVLKKRLSDFEKTIRNFDITRYGIKVGEPLRDLTGILTGRPEARRKKED